MEKKLLEPSKAQLMDDFKVMIANAEALLKATSDQGGEQIAELRAKTEESLNAVKEAIADAQEVIVEKTKAAVKASDDYVHDNPWQAIGIAAGVGFGIGWIVGRR